jgi:hypothetical protein
MGVSHAPLPFKSPLDICEPGNPLFPLFAAEKMRECRLEFFLAWDPANGLDPDLPFALRLLFGNESGD